MVILNFIIASVTDNLILFELDLVKGFELYILE